MRGVAAVVFISLLSPLFACTGIRLTAKDGSTVNGRTVEFGIPLPMAVVVVPRGYAFRGTTPLGKGISYQARYAAVGAMVFGIPALMDGMNERGLCVGVFYFPGFAGYTETTQENLSRSLSPIEFSNWIITQFATVSEVKAALSNIFIAPTASKDWGGGAPPFHYVVYDKAGHCLVIEPVDGKLLTYDNPLGVFTNSPGFDWHMTYLRNFVNLKALAADPVTIEGIEFAPFGMGSGMVGLPGDFTPPSRFVRAAIFSSTVLPSPSAEKAVFQLFHLLNAFDVPLGSAGKMVNGSVHYDYTMATCVKDPQNLKYYFKTYEDQTIRVIDLHQVDWNAKTLKKHPVAGEQRVIDVSKDLK